MSVNNIIPYSSSQVKNLKVCISKVMDLIEAGGNQRSVPIGKWKQNELNRAKLDSGVELRRWGWSQPALHFISSDRGVGFAQNSRSSSLGHVSEKLSDNKELTKRVLQANNVPVARGTQVETFQDALKAHNKYKISVIKPVYGSLYAGVTIAIETQEELEEGWKHAREASPNGPILVEEFIPGVDIRVHVARGKFIAAYMRTPAHVVGDGQNTIQQIIAQKNIKRNTLPGLSGMDLKVSEVSSHYLEKQNLSLDSILKPGDIAILGYNPNLFSGADNFNITDRIHPSIRDIVESASLLLGPADFFGYDVLSTNFTRSVDEAKTIIAESNTRPNITYFQHVSYAQARNNIADMFNSVVGSKENNTSSSKVSRTLKLRGKLKPTDILVDNVRCESTAYGLDVHLEGGVQKTLESAFSIIDLRNDDNSYLLGTEADEITAWNFDEIVKDLQLNMTHHNPKWKSVSEGLQDYLKNKFDSARVIEGTLVEYTSNGDSFITSAAINNATAKVVINDRNQSSVRELLMANGLPVSTLITFSVNQLDALTKFVESFDQSLEVSLKLKKGRSVNFVTSSVGFILKKIAQNRKFLFRIELKPTEFKTDDKLDIFVVGNEVVGSSASLEKSRFLSVCEMEQLADQTHLSSAFAKGQFPELEIIAIKAFNAIVGLRSAVIRFVREGSGNKWYIESIKNPDNLSILQSPDLGVNIDVFGKIFSLHCDKNEKYNSYIK